MIPIAAFGGQAPDANGPTPQQAELLELRQQVQAANEQAVEDAPDAVGSRCRSTLDVEGIGDACVDGDGLLRVVQADGRSATIHGMDAPPIGASAVSYAPGPVAAVGRATVADVNCVPDTQQHYVLVYARPGSVASRYATVAPLLQAEFYKVSAFVDAESRSIEPTAGRHLPVRCGDDGAPVVLQATLDSETSGSASFGDIVDGLRAQGYQFNGDKGSNERYVVYYDSPSTTGAAGTGHVFTSDSSAGAGNQNNKGGLYSIEYRFDLGGGVPHWEVLVHEIMHTMGAVVNAAPHSSGVGHCNDGADVMCYDDGGPTSKYKETFCAAKVLDCNRDDYFNPAPAAGSYLATHWDAAATYNAWLIPYAASGAVEGGGGTDSGTTVGDGTTRGLRDTQRPSAPARVKASIVRGNLVLSWSGGTDNVGVRNFQVRRVVKKGSRSQLQLLATTKARSASIRGSRLRLKPGARYTFSIVARDAAGNVSSACTVTVRIAASR